MLLYWGVRFLGVILISVGLPASEHWFPERVPSIQYPPLAAAASVEGTVKVECLLDEKGSVISVEAMSGEKILAVAAESNAKKWKFRRHSNKTGGLHRLILVYQFRLEGVAIGEASSESIFDYPNVVVVTARKPRWMPASSRMRE